MLNVTTFREEEALLTVQEVADQLARRMNCQVQPTDNPHEVSVDGPGYRFIVASFFGGWQATLQIPDQPPTTFYAEAVEMLELRLKAKLRGLDANF